MSSNSLYPIPQMTSARTLLDNHNYISMYQQSIDDPETFWKEQSSRIHWFTAFKKVKNSHFSADDVTIRWYEGGQTNASFNCLDRHLANRKDQIAIYWEGDEPNKDKQLTYQELYEEVCRCANTLKQFGIKEGDVVAIYMPMVIEGIVTMLACARIGAIHSVVFGGFSAEALANRIKDCKAKMVITADEGVRGGKRIPLKKNVDIALDQLGTESVTTTLVLQHTGADIGWKSERDHWWHDEVAQQSANCPAKHMDSESPLYILYTSGSTGKPNALVHTTGGYLVYAALTHRYVFDYQNGDVYWCNADIGWVTGHTYVTYGPLLNGATIVIHEGTPNYPTPNRLCEIIDKYQVNILYTAPTAIRSLMAMGDESITGTQRDSLQLLGSVGEPINPEAWRWYNTSMGKSRCPIVDTWWQTETGGIMITPLPGATRTKPGSATRPFFGIKPTIINEKGEVQKLGNKGYLVIADSWPGQARTIYGDHQRFISTYFSQYPSYYFSGDGAYQDNDEYYWITGRIDDVINVSGHRFSTAEIESALVAHPLVAEAAAVGYPHDLKGQGIYVYAVLANNAPKNQQTIQTLKQAIRDDIGAIATPDIIQLVDDLPKTRSGKIMRRILRKIAANQEKDLGDVSTLADESVVQKIIEERSNQTI